MSSHRKTFDGNEIEIQPNPLIKMSSFKTSSSSDQLPNPEVSAADKDGDGETDYICCGCVDNNKTGFVWFLVNVFWLCVGTFWKPKPKPHAVTPEDRSLGDLQLQPILSQRLAEQARADPNFQPSALKPFSGQPCSVNDNVDGKWRDGVVKSISERSIEVRFNGTGEIKVIMLPLSSKHFRLLVPGFIDFCINVVWVPDSEQHDPSNITGEWHEYTFDKSTGRWEEIENLPKERPECSPEFKALHPKVKWGVNSELPRHLIDVSPPLPKSPEDYRSNYKMVWLCHHRGFKARDITPSKSFVADEENQRKRSVSIDQIGTLPKRHLLDRDHLKDVVINVLAQVISIVAVFDPITSALRDKLDSIKKEQDTLDYKLVGNIDVEAVFESRQRMFFNVYLISSCQVIITILFSLIAVAFIWEKTIRQIWWYSCIKFGVLLDFENENETWSDRYLNFPAVLWAGSIAVQLIVLVYSTGNWTSKVIFMYVTYGALSALYAPVDSCKQMEEDLISLAKFSESDAAKSAAILKDCTGVREGQALKRIGDWRRWRTIMLAKWAETHDPPVQWDYLNEAPVNLPPNLDLEYQGVLRKYDFSFKMLKVNPEIMPGADAFRDMDHIPYSISFPSFGFDVFHPTQRPSIFSRLRSRVSLSRFDAETNRWSKTLLWVVFERNRSSVRLKSFGKKWRAFWNYVYVVLVNDGKITEFPFDLELRKRSLYMFYSTLFVGILCSAGVSFYYLGSITDLLHHIQVACPTKYDCSGKVCLNDVLTYQNGVVDVGQGYTSDLRYYIGDRTCDNKGFSFCPSTFADPLFHDQYYRHDGNATRIGTCDDGAQPYVNFDFNLNCIQFNYDSGDCQVLESVTCELEGGCVAQLGGGLSCALEGVSCGGHRAINCAACPQGNGALWCNGDCVWDDLLNGCFPLS